MPCMVLLAFIQHVTHDMQLAMLTSMPTLFSSYSNLAAAPLWQDTNVSSCTFDMNSTQYHLFAMVVGRAKYSSPLPANKVLAMIRISMCPPKALLRPS